MHKHNIDKQHIHTHVQANYFLLLAATSSSAQLSRTLVPGHLPLQDQKPRISFRQTFVRLTQSTPLNAL